MIGVHSPEFAFEKNVGNVRRRSTRSRRSPIRSRSTTTSRSGAPSTTGTGPRTTSSMPRARSAYHHFGEGDYDESERVIRQLLAEAGHARPAGPSVADARRRACRAPRTPATCLARDLPRLQRAPRTSPRRGLRARSSRPSTPRRPRCAQPMGARQATGRWAASRRRSKRPAARITFRFHARDLHLVLGAGEAGQAASAFGSRIDGAPPGDDHGVDVDADGEGVVTRPAPLSAHPPVRRDRGPHVRASSSSTPAYRPTPSRSAEARRITDMHRAEVSLLNSLAACRMRRLRRSSTRSARGARAHLRGRAPSRSRTSRTPA